MHVLRGGNEAKIWLEPVCVDRNYGYNRSELNYIVKLTQKKSGKTFGGMA